MILLVKFSIIIITLFFVNYKKGSEVGMDDFSKHRLKKLQKKYGFDLAKQKDDISKYNLTEEEYLSVLQNYDFATKTQENIDEFLSYYNAADPEQALQCSRVLSYTLVDMILLIVKTMIDDPQERNYLKREIFAYYSKGGIRNDRE